MKLPLTVTYLEEDPDRPVLSIDDASGKSIVTADCGFYGPSPEDAEFIVSACNSAMTEERARRILDLEESPAKNGWSSRSGEYFCWFYGEDHATLDGRFTAEQLEALAWWMRNKGAKR